MVLEAMSLKKVVCVNLTQESLQYMPSQDHPMVAVCPENLESRLGELLGDREHCRELGERGYEFVCRYHDALRLAQRLVEMYAMPKAELDRMGPMLKYED